MARWRLLLSDFDFDVFHESNVKHQAAETIPVLRTNCEVTTDLDDELPVWNGKSTEVTNVDISFVYVFTECDA